MTYNIEYVYYDTWFLWNPGAVVLALVLSSILYLVLTGSKEDGVLNINVARPRWIGSIPSVVSVFWLGLYCVIPILCYLPVSYWIDRKRNEKVHA